MNMHSLRDLLSLAGGPVFPNARPIQARPGNNPQRTAYGTRMQYQETPGSEDSMGMRVQNAVGGTMDGLTAPDATDAYMGGGNIAVPQNNLRAHLGRMTGGSPQGFPGDYAASQYPEPNMQQAQPVNVQGVQNPGLIPMQGSRGVKNPQSTKRRGGQISF